MFLKISKKLQLLLGKVLKSHNLYLVIYSDNNWGIVNYWSGDGAFAFNPMAENDYLYEQIVQIIYNDSV